VNLVLFGPPGAGKGTQAQLLCETFKLTHLSTGDAIRAAIRSGSELGKRCEKIVARGELISDDMVTQLAESVIVAARASSDSFLFDGYPRTLNQISQLDELCQRYNLVTPAVITLEVPFEELKLRLTGRRICPSCRKSFNVYLMPKIDDYRCEGCVERLLQRPDDNEQSVQERLRVYREQTEPVINYYEQRGILEVVNGVGTTDEVFTRIYEVLRESY
jgi:adenylate kinase